jgi:hypothetical protein
MLNKFLNFSSYIIDKGLEIRDFYFEHQLPINYLLFFSSIHPSYVQFNSEKKEHENKIKNFSKKKDSKILYESISNIKYEILFDFMDIPQMNKIPFEIKGFIKIKFDFDEQNFPENKTYLKIDFQGKTSDIYLNSKELIKDKDYYINNKEINDNFEQQEKDCIFIAKVDLLKYDNEIYLKFNKTFIEESFNSINNPFSKLEDLNQNNNRSIYVIKIFIKKFY